MAIDDVSTQIEGLLARLPNVPTIVVELYPLLAKATYWVLVDPNAPEPDKAAFLTYPAGENFAELPIFTSKELSTFIELQSQSGATALFMKAIQLFERLKDVVQTGKLEAALNPGHNGIRLTREILLLIFQVANGPAPKN